jgi:hypothetical protein
MSENSKILKEWFHQTQGHSLVGLIIDTETTAYCFNPDEKVQCNDVLVKINQVQYEELVNCIRVYRNSAQRLKNLVAMLEYKDFVTEKD